MILKEVPPQREVSGVHSCETQNVPMMSQVTVVLFVISIFCAKQKTC